MPILLVLLLIQSAFALRCPGRGKDMVENTGRGKFVYCGYNINGRITRHGPAIQYKGWKKVAEMSYNNDRLEYTLEHQYGYLTCNYSHRYHVNIPIYKKRLFYPRIPRVFQAALLGYQKEKMNVETAAQVCRSVERVAIQIQDKNFQTLRACHGEFNREMREIKQEIDEDRQGWERALRKLYIPVSTRWLQDFRTFTAKQNFKDDLRDEHAVLEGRFSELEPGFCRNLIRYHIHKKKLDKYSRIDDSDRSSPPKSRPTVKEEKHPGVHRTRRD